MRKKVVRLAALIGILGFAFIVYKIGPDQIWQNIKQISLENFLILVGLRILYWLLRTMNWKVVMDACQEKTSLLQLFIARMCGHAVSQLTPTAQVGSEATRILMTDCSSRRVCIASVVVDKTIEFFSVIFFTIIGVVGIFFRIVLPMKLKTFFVGGVTIAALLLLFFFFKQKKGLLGWVVDFIAKIRIRSKFLEKNREKIRETDEHISSFYRNHRGSFLKAFLLYSLLIMLWAVEIHLGLIYIGVTDMSFVDSFLITVLGNLAFIFPFIPGSLGIYEATYIGLFALLGRSPGAALTLVLIRRLIALLLAGFGLLGMLKPTPDKKESKG
jgi:uncharacterized protein (TIRG00374 family)